MPARFPNKRPEGETAQEHELQHRRERRDEMAHAQEQQSPTEGLSDWFPPVPTRRTDTMPARAPGEHPAEGETVQEHELEHQRERRDQLVRDQEQPPNKRETWAGGSAELAAPGNMTDEEMESTYLPPPRSTIDWLERRVVELSGHVKELERRVASLESGQPRQ